MSQQLIITLAVDPDFRDDPDLFYQLARAKHDQDDVGLVVHGFTYDVGLHLVQVERTDGPPTPVDLVDWRDRPHVHGGTDCRGGTDCPAR